MDGYYTRAELRSIGIKNIGEDVLISKKVSLYNFAELQIGNHVRIDDFCYLNGKIILGNNIHIAAFTSLIAGDAGIEMHDFSGLSSRVSVYAMSDDYSGNYMTNPTIPSIYTNVYKKKVEIGRHSIVGVGSVILPGGILAEGTAVGSMSLINSETEPWGIYTGIPATRIKERSRNLLQLEEMYLDQQ